jgi:hypothetical protein
MNKLFSLSVIPLATTATVASAMLASAPVQAFTLTGDLQITGNSTFLQSGSNATLTLNTLNVDPSSTGSFSPSTSWVVNTGIPLTANLKGVASNSFGWSGITPGLLQAYSGTGFSNNVVGFTNGVSFTIDGSSVEAGLFAFGPSFLFKLASFSGLFTDGTGGILATGTFTSQGGVGANSYSISATPVPEPLTIIGSGIALGFGGFLKRKQKAAQNKS